MPKKVRPELPAGPDDAMVASWMLSLHGRAAGTRRIYEANLRQFRAWLHAERPGLDLLHVQRADLSAYFSSPKVVALEPATRRNYWVALKAFYGWLHDEEEIDIDPMQRVQVPKANPKPVPVLRDDQLDALFTACRSRRTGDPDADRKREWIDRRDLAVLRLMASSGMRVGEAAALRLDDIDLQRRTVFIRKGKGDKGRVARFDAETAKALDRWLRARGRLAFVSSPNLWIGRQGTLGVWALQQVIKRRAMAAGIDPATVHMHQLRHTFAHQWLANGGTEGDLRQLGGWESEVVMRRYGNSVAAERALDAYDRVRPG